MANFQLLNNVDHKDLKIITERSADLGDNVCGCDDDTRDCKAIASELEPPTPPGDL